MMSKVITVSPFWSYLSFFTLKRLSVILVIFLLCFEIIARLSPFYFGKYVHRPFTVSQRACSEACDSQGDIITWLTNERGARGSLYHDQIIQIAVFGSSTSSNSMVTQSLTWPEQIKANVSENIHVDNYARDGAGNKEIESIFKHLINIKKHYNAILIMDHYVDEMRLVDDGIAFQDWGRLTTEKYFLKSPVLITRTFIDSISTMELVNLITKRIKYIFEKPTITFHHPKPLSRSNRELRNSGKVNFIDLPEEAVTEKKRNYIYSRVNRLNMLAKQISPNIYFISQPVAYDDNELPGVSKRWFSLYPVSKDKANYKSNKSVAFNIRNVQKIVSEAAIINNAKIIDLDSYIRPHLRKHDDLFFDKWHFAPKGNQISGKFIADRLINDNVLK